MSFSTTSLKVQTSDGHNCTLLEEFSYTRPNGEVIVVPVGTSSDGASTPKEFWDILPPFGKYWMAAFLHDYLYRDTQKEKDECDLILFEAMTDLGVGIITKTTIYDGVHYGGKWSFDDDRLSSIRSERVLH